MGKLKNAVQDWLEDYGHSLGYDMSNCPDMKDWDKIKLNNINAEEYYEQRKENN